MKKVLIRILLTVLVFGLLIGGGLAWFWYTNFYAFSARGIVGFTEIEGGCWFLAVDKGGGDVVTYEIGAFEQYRDKLVQVRGRIRMDLGSFCQIGPILEIQKIKLIGDIKEEVKLEKEQVKLDTADWQTYTNAGVNFTFRYPSDWQIVDDFFYETASGIKSKSRWITVGKDEVDSDNWIRINPRQFLTSDGRCSEVGNNKVGYNAVCTYSKNPEILRIFNQIVSTFRFVRNE